MLYKGSQLTMPTNVNGSLNVNSFFNYGLPINKIKCNINFNTGLSYTRTPSFINTRKNWSNTYGVNGGVTLSSNISDKIDFTLSYMGTYNIVKNTLQSNLNSKYLNQSSRAKITCMVWKGLVLQTDISDMVYTGLSSAYNQHYTLWSAAIAWKFLKDRSADLRLSVYDLLKQNRSISRNVTDTYYEDSFTTVLRQYVMLTFTYQIKYFKGKASAPERKQ